MHKDLLLFNVLPNTVTELGEELTFTVVLTWAVNVTKQKYRLEFGSF